MTSLSFIYHVDTLRRGAGEEWGRRGEGDGVGGTRVCQILRLFLAWGKQVIIDVKIT